MHGLEHLAKLDSYYGPLAGLKSTYDEAIAVWVDQLQENMRLNLHPIFAFFPIFLIRLNGVWFDRVIIVQPRLSWQFVVNSLSELAGMRGAELLA